MKRYVMAGLLVWVPLGITIYVMVWLVTTLDQTLLLIPEHLRPEAVFGFHIPGLGVLLSFAILLATGFLAASHQKVTSQIERSGVHLQGFAGDEP